MEEFKNLKQNEINELLTDPILESLFSQRSTDNLSLKEIKEYIQDKLLNKFSFQGSKEELEDLVYEIIVKITSSKETQTEASTEAVPSSGLGRLFARVKDQLGSIVEKVKQIKAPQKFDEGRREFMKRLAVGGVGVAVQSSSIGKFLETNPLSRPPVSERAAIVERNMAAFMNKLNLSFESFQSLNNLILEYETFLRENPKLNWYDKVDNIPKEVDLLDNIFGDNNPGISYVGPEYYRHRYLSILASFTQLKKKNLTFTPGQSFSVFENLVNINAKYNIDDLRQQANFPVDPEHPLGYGACGLAVSLSFLVRKAYIIVDQNGISKKIPVFNIKSGTMHSDNKPIGTHSVYRGEHAYTIGLGTEGQNIDFVVQVNPEISKYIKEVKLVPHAGIIPANIYNKDIPQDDAYANWLAGGWIKYIRDVYEGNMQLSPEINNIADLIPGLRWNFEIKAADKTNANIQVNYGDDSFKSIPKRYNYPARAYETGLKGVNEWQSKLDKFKIRDITDKERPFLSSSRYAVWKFLCQELGMEIKFSESDFYRSLFVDQKSAMLMSSSSITSILNGIKFMQDSGVIERIDAVTSIKGVSDKLPVGEFAICAVEGKGTPFVLVTSNFVYEYKFTNDKSKPSFIRKTIAEYGMGKELFSRHNIYPFAYKFRRGSQEEPVITPQRSQP